MADKAAKTEKKKSKEGENAQIEEPVEAGPSAEEAAAALRASMLESMTGAQKAAVIVSLGVDKASQLYQYMEPEDVEQITQEVAKLGYLNADVTEAVLDEYYQMCLTNKAVTEGGLEYSRTVLEKAFVTQMASNLLDKVVVTLLI